MILGFRPVILTLSMSSIIFTGCGRNDHGSDLTLDPLQIKQAKKDFALIVDTFEELYGPLEYKASHPVVKLDFAAAVANANANLDNAKSDAEIFGIYSKFLRTFRDGHVSIRFPLTENHIVRHVVPIFVMPLKDDEGKWHAVVDSVGSEIADTGLKVGDVITKVDGKEIFDYLPIIQQYKSYSNDVSDQHLIFKIFNRDFFMTELTPQNSLVTINFRSHGSDMEKFATIPWKVDYYSNSNRDIVKPTERFDLSVDMSDRDSLIAEGSLQKMGATDPFFATDAVKNKFQMRMRNKPSAESLKKFGLEEKDLAPIFAAVYKHKGKNILLIRQAGYSPPHDGPTDDTIWRKVISNWIQSYKAILYENEHVDMVVVDQTHNPGGTSGYVFDFFRLFIANPKANLIQKNNIDRKWIIDFETEAALADKRNKPNEARRYRSFAKIIEEASERKPQPALSPAITFDYDFMLNPHDDYTWNKPVLVLADELAGSCGDIFPMLMKRNGVAKVFGQRTMGLGGNVESFTLTSSQASVRLTRGLFTNYRADDNYAEHEYVENNGIEPDYLHELTLGDYHNGFVKYVEAFSDKAVEELK